MSQLHFSKELTGTVEEIVNRITPVLAEVGFGILTRIDFHLKIKEKLNKDLPPTVILGACNPKLAYEASLVDTDILGLIPCNVVVRSIDQGKVLVEITKPTAMMQMTSHKELGELALSADNALEKVLKSL